MPHINEKIDFTVEVFVVYKEKILLRKHDKLGIWLSVGGHIEKDEDPNQAAIREVKEEVNLEITLDNSLQIRQENTDTYKELIPPYFMNRHKISETHEHVTLTYFATTTNDTITQTIDAEKSDDIQWFTKEELEMLPDLLSNVKAYALIALKTISNR